VKMPLSVLCSDIVDCEHKTAPSSLTGFACIGTSDIKGGRIDLIGAKNVERTAEPGLGRHRRIDGADWHPRHAFAPC